MYSRPRTLLTLPAALALCLAFAGCKASGAAFVVQSGANPPQEDLIERVRGALADTSEAREAYGVAFNLYQRLSSPQAVELDDLSDDFADAIEECSERSIDLSDRIETIRKESDELFGGWNQELTRFSGETMRKKSEAMMLDTQARSQRVLEALERAHTRTQPVQQKLQDYGLFFHHNLNARAIATLQDTYKEFDAEFKALQAELDRAQSEVAAFVANFEGRAAAQGAPAK